MGGRVGEGEEEGGGGGGGRGGEEGEGGGGGVEACLVNQQSVSLLVNSSKV